MQESRKPVSIKIKSSLVGNKEVRWAYDTGSPATYISKTLAEALRKVEGVKVVAGSRRIKTVADQSWESKEKFVFHVMVGAHKKNVEAWVFPLSSGHEDAINVGRELAKEWKSLHDAETLRLRLAKKVGDKEAVWAELSYKPEKRKLQE
jgi:hypothetical protein